MKQQTPCDDKSLLIGYLYGECDAHERRAVEQHLAACAACAAELAQLRGVRGALREWAPPEQALGFRVVRDQAPVRKAMRIPAWAQLAAAALVMAAGAAIANLDVRIGNGGVTIRTGWQQAAPSPALASAPWRADLVALERQLRQELSASRVATAAAPAAAAAPAPAPARASTEEPTALLRKVQALIDDTERRQQREYDRQLAERFVRFARDVDSQRLIDLRMFQQGLGQIDVRTTSEVAQLKQTMLPLLRVANVQQMK